jgi:hypothetical protein
MAGTFVALGLTVAGGVVAGVLWSLADAAHADLLEQCPDFGCEPGAWDATLSGDRDRGRALSDGVTGAVVVTSVAAVAMILLAALTPWRRGDAPEPTARGGLPGLALHW